LATAARAKDRHVKRDRSQRKSDRRQSIVETAARLFAKFGYAD